MAQFLEIHPRDPQRRHVKRAAEIIRSGGVIIYPSDSAYALGCRMDNKEGLERIRKIRRLGEDHNFTLICRDIAQVAIFAQVTNENFRLIKSQSPGDFTYLLQATKETPKRLQHSKKKTIGIRLPGNPFLRLLLDELDEPLFSSTLIFPDEVAALGDVEDIKDRVDREVDLVIGSGTVVYEPTTIINLTGSSPEIVRQGRGIADNLR